MNHRITRTTRATRRAGLAALALTAAVGLAACGSDDDGHSMAGHDMGDTGAMGASDSPGASASSAAHTDADVAFASDMIPHHAQAVEMVRMLEGRDVSPELARLAARIEAAQQPEITTMSGWLRQWGKPVPDASSGMGDMSGMDHSTSSGMPGMMTDAEMGALEKATGETFEQMWISMMIRHHGGAVEMARVEVSDGSYAPAIALAKDIIESQSKEILTLRGLQRG